MKTLKKILKVTGIILLVVVGLFSLFLILVKMEIIGFVPDKIPYTQNEKRFIDSLKNTGKYYEVWRNPSDELWRSKYKNVYELNLEFFGFPILEPRTTELKTEALLLSKKLYQEVNQRDTTYYTIYNIVFCGKDDVKFTYRVKDLEE
ncbi:MAG: hypothetical protein IM606_06825 [Cytophagales bacterium]|jgi:hypothetical protein|nr:hypothetical protein [Cytophagales bacterium]MCA6388465.1 hypothetical protein [Cytophagales bacterium]MCA6390890.1 hypothetical protein [Cytophagales bacterium]MCA6394885.1 hypothetical protein [Cytophagales bacterium]MCA6402564.1 hypothetical protein [Cytophagales bacterium]